MENYKFTCTIQEIIETTIGEILGYKVTIHGSGRTDAGVHAREQVFHMKLPFELDEEFMSQLNLELPEDICILNIEHVDGGFHARYDAIIKSYEYVVDTTERPSVFQRKYVYHFPYQLDVGAIRDATQYLIGKHDFSGFTDDKDAYKDKFRTVYEIGITQEAGRLVFRYRGNGFLQHMVRIMTGTLLEVGRGDKAPEDIVMIIRNKERAKAGFLVPAKGLFLTKVEYD